MDNLTHSLFGATLARTPLGRAGRGTTVVLMLASNAPDIDVVAAAGGTLGYLQWHRGPTHGPLGVAVLGLATAVLVWLGLRLFDRRHAVERASFGMLVAASCIGVALHIALDLPTSYGTRALSPFDWHWFALDLMPIVDVYLWLVLAAGLALGRGSQESRRRFALIALVLMAGNYGLRAVTHARALSLAPRALGPLLPSPCVGIAPRRGLVEQWPPPDAARVIVPHDIAASRCLVGVAAIPTFRSPFHWQVVAHVSNAYEIQQLFVLDPRFRAHASPSEALWRLTRRVPNHWTAAALHAASAEPAQRFLGFARFAAVRSTADGQGAATVRWTDVRFDADSPRGRPDWARGRSGLFTVAVRVGLDGRIVEDSGGE